MLLLDKKGYALLDYLVSLDSPKTVTAISKALNQSRRKIYYHLEKINQSLPADISPIVSHPRVGILLTDGQKRACQDLLDALDDYSYVMSVDERLDMYLVYIAVATDKVTIDKLMQLTAVSRNTVLNDLNEIRKRLSEVDYDIQLRVSRAQGYFLSCHPLSKVQFLYRLLYQIFTQGNAGFSDIVRERIIALNGYDDYFSEELSYYFKTKLSLVQQSLGKKLNSQDARFMVQVFPYLILSYRNIIMSEAAKERLIRDLNMTWQRKEYQTALSLARGVEERFNFSLDKIEISLLAMLLLSFRKDSDSHVDSHDFDDLRQTLERFLQALTTKYDLTFAHHEELLMQLVKHCKALLYRKTYDILSVNPLTKYIKERYYQLFEMTRDCASILEEAWLVKLNDDDIAYLVIHLGGELEKHQNQNHSKNHVVLVCDEGIGVQKLLVQQCRQYLVNSDIEAVFTYEQFNSVSDIMKADIIISTSDALETNLPMIIVNPILNDNDKLNLIRFSQTHGKQNCNFSKSLEMLLQPYIADKETRHALKTKVERLVFKELFGGRQE